MKENIIRERVQPFTIYQEIYIIIALTYSLF